MQGVAYLNYVFLDESEDLHHFLIGGVITDSKEKLNDAIYTTRRYIKQKKGLSDKHRNRLLNELKDYQLEKMGFQDIKRCLLENLAFETIKTKNKNKDNKRLRTGLEIFYLQYRKSPGQHFNQETKEFIYLSMLSTLICHFEERGYLEIIFDEFDNKSFIKSIKELQKSNNVITKLEPGKSNEIKELQAADICVGSIRRMLIQEDTCGFAEVMESHLVKIEFDHETFEQIPTFQE